LLAARPICAREPIDQAIVAAEGPSLDLHKSQSLIKSVCPNIAGQGIDQNRLHGRIEKATLER